MKTAASTATSTSSSDLGEATPALAAHDAVKIAPPEVFTIAGGLQLPLHRHRSDQVEPQSLEGRILGRELAHRLDRASLEIPDVHSQHSPLN